MSWLYQPLLPAGTQQQASVAAYTLSADALGYTWTLQSATATVTRKLPAGALTYSLTLQPVVLTWSGAPPAVASGSNSGLSLSLSLKL